MDYLFWIFLIIAFFIFTYLMKWIFNAKIFLFFSMIRSKRLAELLDLFDNKRFWNFIAETGIFLGFGFLGLYFWYKKDKNKWKKIIFWQFFILIISISLVTLLASSLGLINAIICLIIFNLFGLAGFSIYLLGYYSVKIILNYIIGKSSCPGVAPVLPGIQIPGVPIFIPALEGWLSIFIILVLHELAHGVLTRIIKIKVKSFGLILAGFLPFAAFTEPDEKSLLKAKPKDQLKVYASGPMINFYLAIIVMILGLLVSLATSPYVNNIHDNLVDGVYIIGVSEYTGLCNDGELSANYGLIDENVKILSVNNNLVTDLNSFYFIQSNAYDLNLGYATFTLQKDSNVYDQNIYYNSDGKLGIMVQERELYNVNKPVLYLLITFILTFLHWLWLLSLMVAIFNFLPSEPFDGGKMTKIILSEFIFTRFEKKKRYRMIGFAFGMLILLFIIVNMLPLFF